MLYTLPALPEHTVEVPVIIPGVAGTAFSVIACELEADVPHVFVAVTETLPAVEPNVTVAVVVPWPAETLAPAGTVQV
jgi:hypothetical protein